MKDAEKGTAAHAYYGRGFASGFRVGGLIGTLVGTVLMGLLWLACAR